MKDKPKAAQKHGKKKTTSKNQALSSEKKQNIIIGIGSSAGGLTALNQFFEAMPPETGCTFVVISHLDPKHKSLLPALIQKKTSMDCLQATHNMPFEPNKVYFIPPNQQLSLQENLFCLSPAPSNRSILPFNYFLNSLSKVENIQPICVVLSGNGADGSEGLYAIRAANGLIFAEDPTIAEYDSMPSNAIATGLVHHVLSPIDISKQIVEFLQNPTASPKTHMVSINQSFTRDELKNIFDVIRPVIHHDFSQYKSSTVCRRISKRMQAKKVELVADYIDILRSNALEASTLFKEFLIGVTSFFRDTEGFNTLEQSLINFIASKPEGYNFRVWVPGCSSGEEAYSIAILFQECIGYKKQYSVQIFGTDIDEDAVHTARTGIYSKESLEDVSEDRRTRFFIKEKDDRYRVSPIIRDMLVFASHSIIKDPPFTNIDLISCRNLLIYFSSNLQKKLVPILNFSLKNQGLLFLGPSESLGTLSDTFLTVSRKWKLFQKNVASFQRSTEMDFPLFNQTQHTPIRNKNTIAAHPQSVDDYVSFHIVESILQQSSLPSCLIIDAEQDIVYIHGDTSLFLEPSQGIISTNLFKMARMSIKKDLFNLLQHVKKNKIKFTSPNIPIKDNNDVKNICITASALQEHGFLKEYQLISFRETVINTNIAKDILTATAEPQKNDTLSNDELQTQLKRAQFNLKSTIDELEISNEELKSSNEELQSTNEELQSSNEELQSTNEEMESSKEELQSLNEESSTVNVELQSRIDELNHSSDDMKNLINSVDVAAIFLDTNSKIRRFTKNIVEIIPLTDHDVGRPIDNFSTKLNNTNLDTIADNVMANLKTFEADVEASTNQIYKIKARPYRTGHNVIDGTVLTFENRTDVYDGTVKLEQKERTLTGILDAMPGLVIILDATACITYFNRQSQLVSGYLAEEVLNKSYIDLLIFIPQEKKVLQKIFDQNTEVLPISQSTPVSWRCKEGSIAKIKWTYTFVSNSSNTSIETIIANGVVLED